MQTSHSILWGPICLLAFSMNKPTPNQFATSKICYHEIFVSPNDCTHKVSLSFWIIPRRLQLRENTDSKPSETESWRKWTESDKRGGATGEGQNDNAGQKLNSPPFSPLSNFPAKNICSASSRWRENGLFTICRDKTSEWNHSLKGKLIRNRVK